MKLNPKSIRTFIGAKDFNTSRAFYNRLGFTETVIDPKMSYFSIAQDIGFYLQDYYLKGWIENSMIFLEIENLESTLEDLRKKNLTATFKTVKLSGIKEEEWGSEFFLHDPAGVLWHFGNFKNS